MSLTNFVPTIWSAELLLNLRKSLVLGQAGIVNRDYEGEIRNAGDTVKINSIGAVTVDTYTPNVDMDPPETLTDATRSLVIDQSKYFHFQVDDVDQAQQTPKVMAAAMAEAAYALADVADQFLAAKYDDAGTDMDPITPTADTAYELLVGMGIALDEESIPSTGRWAVVPPWFHGFLLQDDRFVGPGTSGPYLINGEIGSAAGFRLVKSNNLVTTGSDGVVTHVLAGHPMAWTYAEQINSVEAYRPPLRFGDAVKGLHLYGAKVVRPAALVHAAITRSGI